MPPKKALPAAEDGDKSFLWTLWHNVSNEALFKVAARVFEEWPRRDDKNFQAMSELDVTVTSLSFAENQQVRGLRLQISSDKQIFPFRCNLK